MLNSVALLWSLHVIAWKKIGKIHTIFLIISKKWIHPYSSKMFYNQTCPSFFLLPQTVISHWPKVIISNLEPFHEFDHLGLTNFHINFRNKSLYFLLVYFLLTCIIMLGFFHVEVKLISFLWSVVTTIGTSLGLFLQVEN